MRSVSSEPAQRSCPGGPSRGAHCCAWSFVMRWGPVQSWRPLFRAAPHPHTLGSSAGRPPCARRPCPALPSEVRPRGMRPPLFGLKPAWSCLPRRAPSPVLAAPAHLAPLHKPLFLYRCPHQVVLGCGISVPGTLYSGKFPNHQGSRRFLCFNSGSLGTKNSRGRARSRRSPVFREDDDSAAHSEGSVHDGGRFCIRLWPGRTWVCLLRDEWTLSWTRVGDAGWGLVSPGRGPPTSEPQHAHPGRAPALHGTDGWMKLGETSHTRHFRAEWGLPPEAPDRAQSPQPSLLPVSGPFVHPDSFT